jgi:hypothetical protein
MKPGRNQDSQFRISSCRSWPARSNPAECRNRRPNSHSVGWIKVETFGVEHTIEAWPIGQPHIQARRRPSRGHCDRELCPHQRNWGNLARGNRSSNAPPDNACGLFGISIKDVLAMADLIDSLLADDPAEWITAPPEYQRNSIQQLLASGLSYESVAQNWLSASAANTYQFSSSRPIGPENAFLDNLRKEVRGLPLRRFKVRERAKRPLWREEHSAHLCCER